MTTFLLTSVWRLPIVRHEHNRRRLRNCANGCQSVQKVEWFTAAEQGISPAFKETKIKLLRNSNVTAAAPAFIRTGPSKYNCMRRTLFQFAFGESRNGILIILRCFAPATRVRSVLRYPTNDVILRGDVTRTVRVTQHIWKLREHSPQRGWQ